MPTFNGKVFGTWWRDTTPKWSETTLSVRAVAAEFVGMMFFVVVGCGTAVTFSLDRQYNAFLAGAGGTDAAAAAPSPRIASFDSVLEQTVNQLTTSASWGVNTALAFGIGIACMCYSLGHVSGGHFNPAVTISLLISGNCGVVQAVANICAQLLGAITAAGFLYGIVPRGIGSNLGSNVVAPDFSAGAALGAEIFFTALLVFVVHSTACTTSNNVAPMAPLAIGLSVFLAHAVMLPIDGCSINPARSFGPALVSNTWGDFWVFVVGPIVGGVIGVMLWLVCNLEWDKPGEGAHAKDMTQAGQSDIVDVLKTGMASSPKKADAAASPAAGAFKDMA